MNATHAYVMRRPCGHPIELVVDLPDEPKATAKAVAAAIRNGYAVERVTIEQAREIGITYCECTQPAKPKRRGPRGKR